VVALNGRPVRGSAELRARLGVVPVGETVELTVQRGQESQVVKARIGELERPRVAATAGPALPGLGGASVANAQRNVLLNREVVLVTDVQAGSEAFSHGLRAGDYVVGVNQRRVRNIAELANVLRQSGPITLQLVRGDTNLNLPVR
jgi:serine protease Do/serine protease DegQ